MSEQYPGGFINQTAPTLNPALGNAAPGIWNMTQVQQAVKSSTWPGYDPYYKYVTLNLHGNGTNGAQNNTFLDSSTNNFTITRNGNTTQGAFSPYGSNWSNYFDGSSAYLSIANATPLQLSGSQFTIEGWFYLTVGSTDNNELVCQSTSSADSAVNYQIRVTAGNKLRFLAMTSGATAVYFDGTTTITTNTWHHFACVCDGSGAGAFLRSWVDGVYQGASSSFNAANINTNSAATQIGAWTYSSQYLSGYISNFRILKGTALYTGTSNITVPTAPLTAITNTSLLICQSNRFIDNSSNGYTVTTSGSPSVQRFSPFSPTSAYSTSVIGGSGYFDGSGDYLRVAYNSNLYPTSSGTDYTVECWVYPTAGTGGLQFVLGTNNTSVADWTFTQDAGQWGFTLSGVGGNAGTVIANQWTHLAMTRNGTTVNGYVNGTRVLTTTASTQSNNGLPLNIGMRNGSDRAITGYITDIRIVNGTAVYTGASYTVPTAPLTAVTNTQLLMSSTNAGILDNSMVTDLETVGTAQISTSVYKYGGGAIAVTASGDYCKGTQPSTAQDINGGDFTIEFWVYFTSVAADRALISKYGNSAETAGGLGYVVQWVQSSAVLRLVLGVGGGTDNLYTWSWSPSTSTWYHVAITRSGTSGRAFVNGTQIGTTSTLTTSDTASPNSIQIGKTHTVAQYLLGYMDDVRITKGVARYTANFTAPTSQLQDQ